jgi:hypothetical protein
MIFCNRILAIIIFLLLLVLLVVTATYAADEEVDAVLVPPTPEEYADIQKWISSTCCWTNNCCRKVKPSALTPLGDDHWRVEATGQISRRTGWSQDGNTWRCTCDYSGSPIGRWIVHLKANTRCIFPVASGS